MTTIVLTGGGTAGHVTPCLALLPELKKHFDNIHYVGGNGIEQSLAVCEGLPYHKTTVVKLDRSDVLSNLKIPFIFPKCVAEAKDILTAISPNVVFSKGGYVSLPTCFAAKSLGIPVVCHESDFTLGVANKLVSKFAAKTLTSFPETRGGTFVGNPVRKEFLQNISSLSAPLLLDKNKKTVLFCGGSLGSTAINKVVYEALTTLLKLYNVIHIAGKTADFSIKYPRYYQYGYTEEFPSLLSLCDVTVCRAGANTLTEAATLNKRCLAVPLPKGASRGDQLLNAESFKKRGYCEILLQDDLNVESLLTNLSAIWNKPTKKLSSDSIAKNIVNEILSVI